ncbi:hypothetical protein ABQF30_16130 [Mycolicibacterium sp. XJ870]
MTPLVPATDVGWQRYESAGKRRSAFRDLGPPQTPGPRDSRSV